MLRIYERKFNAIKSRRAEHAALWKSICLCIHIQFVSFASSSSSLSFEYASALNPFHTFMQSNTSINYSKSIYSEYGISWFWFLFLFICRGWAGLLLSCHCCYFWRCRLFNSMYFYIKCDNMLWCCAYFKSSVHMYTTRFDSTGSELTTCVFVCECKMLKTCFSLLAW